MKKMLIALTIMLTMAATGKAMSYEQARNEALFLTDKMAYELNLTDEQYEAAYEINLDYLMGVTCYDDVFGDYWERRNRDLSYVLLDWQWNSFCAATYFYRPLTWSGGYWHFSVYIQYPRRDFFYFGRPVFYGTYRGCHAWHVCGGHGYYYSRRTIYCVRGRSHFGMYDRWCRGDYRRISGRPQNHRGSAYGGRSFSGYGGSRSSSTRTTVNQNGGSFGGYRDGNSFRGASGASSSSSASGASGSRGFGGSRSGGSYSGFRGASSSSSASSASGSRGFGGSRSGGSYSGGSRSSASFGGSRSGGSVSSSAGSSHSSHGGRSFGGYR